MREVQLTCRIVCAALCGALGVTAVPALAQQRTPEDRVSLLSSVAVHRRQVIGDTTQFDPCRVFEVAGRPANFPHLLNRAAARLIPPLAAPCGAAGKPFADAPRTIRVDSAVFMDTTARVYLTVRRGENLHREVYNARRFTRGDGWGISSVTLYGALRVYRSPDAVRTRDEPAGNP